jgi:hypothetical protein
MRGGRVLCAVTGNVVKDRSQSEKSPLPEFTAFPLSGAGEEGRLL